MLLQRHPAMLTNEADRALFDVHQAAPGNRVDRHAAFPCRHPLGVTRTGRCALGARTCLGAVGQCYRREVSINKIAIIVSTLCFISQPFLNVGQW